MLTKAERPEGSEEEYPVPRPENNAIMYRSGLPLVKRSLKDRRVRTLDGAPFCTFLTTRLPRGLNMMMLEERKWGGGGLGNKWIGNVVDPISPAGQEGWDKRGLGLGAMYDNSILSGTQTFAVLPPLPPNYPHPQDWRRRDFEDRGYRRYDQWIQWVNEREPVIPLGHVVRKEEASESTSSSVPLFLQAQQKVLKGLKDASATTSAAATSATATILGTSTTSAEPSTPATTTTIADAVTVADTLSEEADIMALTQKLEETAVADSQAE
jgi:hypothetical protein